MAEDQGGLRKDALRDWAPWTKLFTAFKVALDPKKLLLAAAGILFMSLGWWLLSALFWMTASKTPPDWANYKKEAGDDKDKLVARWKEFKSDRERWDKLYE